MKAAVLYEVNQPLVIEDVSLPKPGPREVLITHRLSLADLDLPQALLPQARSAAAGAPWLYQQRTTENENPTPHQ